MTKTLLTALGCAIYAHAALAVQAKTPPLPPAPQEQVSHWTPQFAYLAKEAFETITVEELKTLSYASARLAPLAQKLREELLKDDPEAEEYRDDEQISLSYYTIQSKLRDFTDLFKGLNLEKVGDDDEDKTQWEFCGKIDFIIQYNHTAYIVRMYRSPNIFALFLAEQLSDGTYEILDDHKPREIYLPELYKKLDFLFDEDPRFNKINEYLRQKGIIEEGENAGGGHI